MVCRIGSLPFDLTANWATLLYIWRIWTPSSRQLKAIFKLFKGSSLNSGLQHHSSLPVTSLFSEMHNYHFCSFHRTAAWEYEHACPTTYMTISCVETTATPYIHIIGAEYGAYEIEGCEDCSCEPEDDRDCLVDVLDVHPDDLDDIIEECHNETTCSFVVKNANLEEQCGTSAEFLRVHYACTDGKSGPLAGDMASCSKDDYCCWNWTHLAAGMVWSYESLTDGK